MSYKKKQLIGNIALGIAFFALLSWLGSVPVFCIVGTDFENYEPIFTILFILFLATSVITFIILYLIKYDFDEPISETFKLTTKYKMVDADYEILYNKFNNKIRKQNYELVKKHVLGENSIINIYMQPKAVGNLNLVILIKINEYNKEKTAEIQKILSEFSCNLYNTKRVKDYIKSLIILSVDRMNIEFQKFCCEGIKCTSSDMMLPVGISFGNKKMYIMETESSVFDNSIFDLKRHYEKQEELKNLLFKLIDVNKVEDKALRK